MKIEPAFSHGPLMNMPDDASVRIEPGDHKAQSHQGTEPGTGRIEHMAKNETRSTGNAALVKTRKAPRSPAKVKDPNAPVFLPAARGEIVELEDGRRAIVIPREIEDSHSTTETASGTGINLGRWQATQPLP